MKNLLCWILSSSSCLTRTLTFSFVFLQLVLFTQHSQAQENKKNLYKLFSYDHHFNYTTQTLGKAKRWIVAKWTSYNENRMKQKKRHLSKHDNITWNGFWVRLIKLERCATKIRYKNRFFFPMRDSNADKSNNSDVFWYTM